MAIEYMKSLLGIKTKNKYYSGKVKEILADGTVIVNVDDKNIKTLAVTDEVVKTNDWVNIVDGVTDKHLLGTRKK